MNITAKDAPAEDNETSDESDRSVGEYHNFTIKDKVLKEILKNVTPQILTEIHEETHSK